MAQNVECSFGCIARSAVLLKPNVANIFLFNFFVNKNSFKYSPITLAINCNGHSLLICEEKWLNYGSGSEYVLNTDSFWVCRLFNVCVWVFCAPKSNNSACLHTRQDKKELHLKRWFFFVKTGIFCKSIAGPFSVAKVHWLVNWL